MTGKCKAEDKGTEWKHCTLVGNIVSHGSAGEQFWSHCTSILN